MEYILKSTAILMLFYLFYKIFLQRDTFFNSIRTYFLIGIVSAIVTPFIVITKYIQVDPISLPTNIVFMETSPIANVESFNWPQLIFNTYLLGILFFSLRFLWQLSSLIWFLYTHPKSKKGKYILLETKKNITPFSFFNYIVFNSTQFDDNELEQIITHEKVHANQWHSIDIIVSQLVVIFNWFNPFIWLYNREIQKNLEYAADEITQNALQEKKKYQYLLLKTISPDFKMALASNFYNTLIKKRIDMLQKNRSNKTMQFKFALIIPILIAFVFTYNTETIAQTKKSKPEKEEKENSEAQEIIEVAPSTGIKDVREKNKATESEEVIEIKENAEVNEIKEKIETRPNHQGFIIGKNHSEYDLNKLMTDASVKGINIKIKGIKRNSKGEITTIKIDVRSENSSANFNSNSDKPIKPIKILVDEEGENISIGNIQISNQNKSFISDLENISLNNTYNFSSLTEFKNYIPPSYEYYVLNINDNISIKVGRTDSTKTWAYHNSNDLVTKKYGYPTNGVYGGTIKHPNVEHETEKNKNVIEAKEDVHGKEVNSIFINADGKKPLIIVDGKEVPNYNMENIKPDDIESIDVSKGEGATKKYGDKAKDGVIEITTKKNNKK